MKTWEETFMGDYIYLPVEEQAKIEAQYLAELSAQRSNDDPD